MKKTVFIKNALILTVSSLILRFAGIIFKVWLASLIGSEGIGLYQLVFSVYVLAATFATSGISTAVTRLTAEEMAVGSKRGTLKILRRCLELTLLIALITVIILFFGADFIAKTVLGDARAAIALKILPFSLPFMGISSCLKGYFIAARRASPNAISQIFEQLVRILIVVFLLKNSLSKGLAYCCGAVLFGDVVAEGLSCIMLAVIFFKQKKNLNRSSGRARPPYKILSKILHISVPITSGRYLNTALRTAENILVPKNLAKYPKSGDTALSQFGMIKGMALPILFFPSTLLNSISTLLIPEMSEASAKNQKWLVKSATENILSLTAVVSFIFSAIFLVAGDRVGMLIYKSPDVGFLLKALSPIVPLMYLDSISDGILKGLDQQLFSFRTAISDSVIRIVMILCVLPLTGLYGFIGIMYFSNLLTCLLNVGRLLKISKAKINFTTIILIPILTAFSVTLLCETLISLFNIHSNLYFLIILCVVCIPVYLFFMLAFGALEKEYFLRFFKK